MLKKIGFGIAALLAAVLAFFLVRRFRRGSSSSPSAQLPDGTPLPSSRPPSTQATVKQVKQAIIESGSGAVATAESVAGSLETSLSGLSGLIPSFGSGNGTTAPNAGDTWLSNKLNDAFGG